MRLKDGTDVMQLMHRLKQWESELIEARVDSQNQTVLIDDLHHDLLGDWYITKIEEIESDLRNALDDPDVEGLFTGRFWQMMDHPGGGYSRTFHFEPVCHYQAEWLKAVRQQLEALAACAQGTGAVVVPDSNVFAHCGTVSEIDWCALTGAAEVRVIIPHVVLDELDDLKRTGRDRDVRLRVRTAISALKHVLGGNRPGSAVHAGKGLTVAVLPDPRGHRRLSSNDEEICDRALMLRQLTEPVVLATNDMGMHIRAHAFGLNVLEIPEQQPT